MVKTRGAAEKKPAKKAPSKKAPTKAAPAKAEKAKAGNSAAGKAKAKAAGSKATTATKAKAPVAKTAAKKAPAVAKSAKTAPAKSAKTGPAKSSAKTAAPKAAASPKAKPAKDDEAKKRAAARRPEDETRPVAVLVDEPDLVEEYDEHAPPRRIRPGDESVRAHPDAGLTQRQVDILYEKLVAERERVLVGHDRHLSEALADSTVMPDETDMAQRSTEQAYLIRFADKERKLLTEIEHALEKMRTGEYGVCEGTDEPIGYKRLELRPWTRYSVGYKEQMERERSQHRR